MFSVIMLWAASIDGQLSSLVACHCTDLYLFNLFVHLVNKLSLSVCASLGHCLQSVLIKDGSCYNGWRAVAGQDKPAISAVMNGHCLASRTNCHHSENSLYAEAQV